MTVDYKATVFLPRTDFPMKAGLARREPEILARWASLDLWRRQRARSQGRERFVLHDGPPYANGHIHIGTALNKILKDVISRAHQMLGFDSVYVPGWDCHGLPIEWKIEEQYRAAGRDKDSVPVVEFRRECREFAERWIDVQRKEFQRLGVIGDWDNPYTTMSFAAEAQIVREFGRFLMSGQVYRGARPVLWSVPERTALADAEVEYHDHRSTTIFVRFPVAEAADPAVAGADVVIWTTTPWTIPGTRAVACGEGIDYVVIEVTAAGDRATAGPGDRLVVAEALLADVAARPATTDHRPLARPQGGALREAGKLLGQGRLDHSYPHSWRSKAPLIFRNTPQWFISMEAAGLRDKALAAIDATRFVPASGQRRLRGMVETRPDWCVSRQRLWGVPITLFLDRTSGEPLRDPAVLERIAEAVAVEGADVWFTADPSRFLGDGYDPARYEQVTDFLGVWFDSGSTHAFVLEARDDLVWPASLYLEGSDQHRGWFHSSLLESCGTRGRAPYDAVLTHGFVMAEDGQKMSKSLGNTVSPQDVADQHGADILRLWVVGSDYSEDLRIGPEILKQHADVYRRLRNTLRFLLGNLAGFDPAERLPVAEMPELERWVLHRLWELDGHLRRACADFQFHGLFGELHGFCAVDLSAFYFDVRKDSLYCDAADDPRRRAARTVLDLLFDHLTRWLAPFICFTAEEAWLARHPSADGSVHLETFPAVPAAWRDDALAARWETLRRLRRVVTGALEVARASKRIGASLQADPLIFAGPAYHEAVAGVDLAELCITSAARLAAAEPPADAWRLDEVPDVAVVVDLAGGTKCERCWRVLEEVGRHPRHPGACGRCADVVERMRTAAE